MDGIVKIVLALKLKFLLIVLSIGTSYFIEHSAKKNVEPVPSIEVISTDTGLKGSGHPDIRLLFRKAKDKYGSRLEATDHIQIQSTNYFTDKPFNSQGLEIYIVL